MGAPAVDGLRRHLRVVDAAAIFVGIVLGSGIFIAPAAVAAAAPHPAAAAALWLAGAVVCACGAMTYAECAARLPKTGGFFVFYRVAYGEPVAFVGGWAAVAVTYPASVAAIALVLSRYLGEIAGDPADTAWPAAVAIAFAAALTAIGLRAGAVAQRVLTASKVTALLLLCLAALAGSRSAPAPQADPVPAATLLGAVLVLLWTYEGWSDVTLVAGEVRDPGRALLRAVLAGTAVLAVLYALVQFSVTSILGADAATSARPVADAVARGLGAGSAKVVAALVVLCTFGSIQAIVFTTSRLAFAMARDRVFPSWFGVLHPVAGTPVRATLAVASAALVYVAFADFRGLLAYFTFAVWIFYGATAVSLLILRRRGVASGDPIRPPLGGVAPFVVLATGLAMTGNLLVEDTQRSLTGLAILGAGFPVWLVVRALSRIGGGSSAPPR